MSRLPTGVTVLTAPATDRHEVMTANAVISVSLQPTLMLVSVTPHSRWLAAVRERGTFAINILAEHHEPLARWCADASRHERPEVITSGDVRVAPSTGTLLLNDAIVAIECRLFDETPAGDHVLVLGVVTELHVQDTSTSPLVFVDRGYGTTAGEPAPLRPVREASCAYPPEPEVPAVAASG